MTRQGPRGEETPPLPVELVEAGWTQHPGAIARRGAPWAPIRFPALVALIHHPHGVVLFDTGYAPRVARSQSRGINRIYGALLPVHVREEDTVEAQLRVRGIEPEAVSHVVLSHLHADHLGGLLDLPNARVITSPIAVAAMRPSRGLTRLARGWLPDLLPGDLEHRLRDPADLPRLDLDLDPLPAGGDLFGDGSLAVVPLPGHAPGHLGLWVRSDPQLLLLGDAVWDLRAATHGELPHPVVRLVTRDWAGYRATAAALGALAVRRSDLLLLPSHDAVVLEQARARLAGR